MSERAINYEQLKQHISQAYPGLPKQLQRIARFALEKPHDLALGTVAAVAEAAEVQPSSMIRFANALGFGGFSEMQQIFRGHLVERSASYRERIEQMRRGNGRPAAGGGTGVLRQFVDEAITELSHLDENVNPADMKAAVRLLAGAQLIHVLGQRRAFPIASYLAYALRKLDLRTQLLDGVGGMLGEFVRGVAPGDVLIAISTRNYSPEVVDAAAACHQRGVAVIAITDSPLSPLKPPARVCFELGDDSAQQFRSLVGQVCLSQALVVATGHHLADRASPRKRRTNGG
ncbi:MurR/RpiR family transcriptional regulator [Piscinibacter sp.]|uniref:MurR/RpiR family transcriptional regulator n=1 Tax=Piscinibacter sp. TaxID=1903157 RepID=UPI002B7D95D0|nr:MurR/RpiR family transcriptional regulator [Albitalea sp.]HUG25297.1 MurR/RpiR family transcriptional regulator [Albitalea sp.]